MLVHVEVRRPSKVVDHEKSVEYYGEAEAVRGRVGRVAVGDLGGHVVRLAGDAGVVPVDYDVVVVAD